MFYTLEPRETVLRVGERLQNLRLERRLTIEDLKSKTGISVDSLYSIESGKLFDLDDLLKLCCFYGIEPKILLSWDF